MPRIKHVLQNPFHLWAHQTYAQYGASENHGRNASDNRSFQGPDAYSYSTVVASIAKDKKGNPVYLVTTREYSVTTSCMMGEIRRAIPDTAKVFNVPNTGSSESDHKSNMAYLINNAYTEIEKAASAKGYPLSHLDRAFQYIESARDYKKTFGLKGTKFSFSDSSRYRYRGGYGSDFDANMPTPKTLAKWESLREVYAEKQRAFEATRDERRQKRDKAAAERWEREKALAELKREERLEKWLAGENVPTHLLHGWHYGSNITANMRLKGHNVQTTQGAEVPAHHVKKAMALVLKFVNAGREFKCPPETPIRLGHYSLHSITADGLVTVGCHKFDKAEVLRFAAIMEAYVPKEEAA